MGFGVRVSFLPLNGSSSELQLADGAAIRLQNLGRAGSGVTVAPKPARIVFIGAFFDAARAASATEARQLAVVNGTIEQGSDGNARFTGDGAGITGSDATLDVFQSPNPPRLGVDQAPPRVLRLRFEQPDFFQVLPNGASEAELLVAVDSKTVLFMEVGARLEIAGAIEADEQTNDRLDIVVTGTNPPPLQLLSVRLHDAAALPFPAAAVRVTLPGETRELVADGEGFVTFLLPPACPPSIGLDWGVAPGDQPLHADIAVDCSPRTDGSEAVARLQNLGYPALENLELSVRAFQRAYQVDHRPQPIGLLFGTQLPPRTQAKLQAIFAGGCDATPSLAEEDRNG
jgi:hypothetical protein